MTLEDVSHVEFRIHSNAFTSESSYRIPDHYTRPPKVNGHEGNETNDESADEVIENWR